MQWVKNFKSGGRGTLVHQPGIRVEDSQMSLVHRGTDRRGRVGVRFHDKMYTLHSRKVNRKVAKVTENCQQSPC
jgi:hypothetical protein